jgi:hypothetical protein
MPVDILIGLRTGKRQFIRRNPEYITIFTMSIQQVEWLTATHQRPYSPCLGLSEQYFLRDHRHVLTSETAAIFGPGNLERGWKKRR